MAVNSASVATNASQRRLLYGANVVLGAALAVALLCVAVYLGDRFKAQFDWTKSGLNSLSPATRQLLNKLDQKIRITSLYTVLSEYDKKSQKRYDTVKDLLALYESAGHGHITTEMVNPIKEPNKIDTLLERLRAKPAYQNETKAQAEALQKFPALNQKILQLAQGDYDQFHKFAQADPRLGKIREFKIIESNLQQCALAAQQAAEDIAELQKSKIPRYARALQTMNDYLTRIRTLFNDGYEWMTKDAKNMTGAAPETLTFFQTSGSRYGPLLAEIDELLKQTQELVGKKVKLEDIYDQLSRWSTDPPILVESDNEARVLSSRDVWPPRMDPNAAANGEENDFVGEQAVSSALLQLTQKDKTAVIFTRFGGEPLLTADFSRMNPMMRQMPRAPYQALKEQMEKANFTVLEWDVAAAKTPPPSEGAARTVYVVFPPEPAAQPNPMQPAPQGNITPADKKLILDAAERAGMAIFLTGWSEPSSMFTAIGPPYEFAEYLKANWGIDVQYRYLALQFAPSQEAGKQGLYVPASRDVLTIVTPPLHFTDHPITKPLQALPGAFQTVAPLKLLEGKDRPTGVDLATVAEIEKTGDVWAFEDIQRVQDDLRKNRGTRQTDKDIASPFPVAVMGTNPGKKQKIAVFSSERFAADALTQAMGIQPTASGIAMYPLNPANADLFLNTLHWLTGDADRIAIGPRRADVPRLDKLKEGAQANFWRVFLVGIWPALALVVGGGVWLFRRR